MSGRFDEHRFRRKVASAMEQVTKILDTERHPAIAEVRYFAQPPAASRSQLTRSTAAHQTTPHAYDDKYRVAEFVANLALAAELNCLEVLGVDEPKLRQLLGWAQGGRAVTLRLAASERCAFDRAVKRDVESATKTVKESTGIFAGKSESKLVTTVTEFFWAFGVDYELFAYRGTDPDSADDRLSLLKRGGTTEIMSTTKKVPRAIAATTLRRVCCSFP